MKYINNIVCKSAYEIEIERDEAFKAMKAEYEKASKKHDELMKNVKPVEADLLESFLKLAAGA